MLPTSRVGRPARGLARRFCFPGLLCTRYPASPHRLQFIKSIISVGSSAGPAASWLHLVNHFIFGRSLSLRSSASRCAVRCQAITRAVRPVITAICANSSAVGLGCTAQSAKDHHAMLAEHRVGNQHNEGSRYNADAGSVFTYWNAGRNTSPVALFHRPPRRPHCRFLTISAAR